MCITPAIQRSTFLFLPGVNALSVHATYRSCRFDGNRHASRFEIPRNSSVRRVLCGGTLVLEAKRISHAYVDPERKLRNLNVQLIHADTKDQWLGMLLLSIHSRTQRGHTEPGDAP